MQRSFKLHFLWLPMTFTQYCTVHSKHTFSEHRAWVKWCFYHFCGLAPYKAVCLASLWLEEDFSSGHFILRLLRDFPHLAQVGRKITVMQVGDAMLIQPAGHSLSTSVTSYLTLWWGRPQSTPLPSFLFFNYTADSTWPGSLEVCGMSHWRERKEKKNLAERFFRNGEKKSKSAGRC